MGCNSTQSERCVLAWVFWSAGVCGGSNCLARPRAVGAAFQCTLPTKAARIWSSHVHVVVVLHHHVDCWRGWHARACWIVHHRPLEHIQLIITQLECECMKIQCMVVELEQRTGYDFGARHDSVIQIPQESLVLFRSRVTSHSIQGIPLDAVCALEKSFLSDESGNLSYIFLDSGAAKQWVPYGLFGRWVDTMKTQIEWEVQVCLL